MIKVEYAYHVTNLPVLNESYEVAKKRFFTELKLTVSDDTTYDGKLVGLPCVFFSTTRYKGGLPTLSTYPRTGNSDEHWRVQVPLTRFQGYEMWKVGGTRKEQIHLLLVTAEQRTTLQLKNFPSFFKKLDGENEYLYFKDNEWFTNEYTASQFFVNFCVIHPVTLDETCKWTTVKKRQNSQTGQLQPPIQDLTELRFENWKAQLEIERLKQLAATELESQNDRRKRKREGKYRSD